MPGLQAEGDSGEPRSVGGGGGGLEKERLVVAPGLRLLPRSAAICHITHGKLSGCLRSSGFVRKYSQDFKKDVRGLSRGAPLALDGYDWPGNRT
jgi:hypothetical protein